MESMLWSCKLVYVFAGLVAVVNAQCTSINQLFRVDAYPTSSTVEVSDDVTLTCETRSPLNTPSGYSWHRVNGDVPSHASGQKTDTLTIHRIVPIDEGEYYCMAIWFGHCARSDSVTVIVKITCPSLNGPSNGTISCSLRDAKVPSYEDTCDFTCNTGYELTGSDTRTCQNNGSWSGSIAMCSRVSCPSLDSPSNGMISCSLGNDGVPSYEDTCNFTCNTGYELTGSEIRICQSNGSWSGSTAMCRRISCPSLDDSPSNGMISCSLGDDAVPSYEDTCSFTCNTGYELTGSDTRTCQSNGSWSGSTGMCNVVSCPSLVSPSNGMMDCSLGDDEVPSYEDTCNFTCNTGYELSDSETRTCQSDGSWSGSTAMCSRVSCPSLDIPSNGKIDCSLGSDEVPSYEDTCSITCDTGYELTNSDTRTCQSDGSWSGSIAMCSRVSCSSLDSPSNGMINCSLGDDGVPSYEDTCNFTCNTGYKLTGSETRTCQSDEEWSGSTVMCSRVSCPSLDNPINGMMDCSLGNDEVPSYEDTCNFTCNTGYELTGSDTRTCQSDGSWSSSTAMCNRVSCPPLTDPSNGMINCSLGDEVPSYEDTCNFTCNTGYELTGSETRTCQSDGSWSGSIAMCSRVSCPPLTDPSNGMMDCSLGDDEIPSFEDTCSFTCNTGYELTGSETRICQSDRSWSGSTAMCSRVSCPPLTDPSNGMINCSLGDDAVPSYEDTCGFTCNTGYELTGSETRTCLSNGSWSGSTTMCRRISCPSLDSPSNGMINCSLGDDEVPSYEDTCSITCDTGYELTGSETRTCQSDGSWSGSIAMCSRVSCPSLDSPSNGTINCSLGDDAVPSYEDTCSITCDTGYELTGSETRTCQSDGSWSGSTTMCGRVIPSSQNCQLLTDPSNGMIKCSLRDEVPSYEDTCNFTCNTGYELTGSETRTCQSDGSWSGSIAMCSRISCPSLDSPSNGMINCSLGDDAVPSYEDTCSFTCDTGYELTGSETRTCQNNGSWSGSNAMCTIECTIKGQIIKQCASYPNCTKTCNNTLGSIACAQICLPNGCECPDGMVVDEENNECIDINDCPTMPPRIIESCPGEGQSFSSNCHPLNATCSNPFPPVICDAPMCSCPMGQALDEKTNKCVNTSECILCSIKGQIRTDDCFGLNATCSNPNPERRCDHPQCVCPKGQVIDEVTNACINGKECRSACNIKRISGTATYSNIRKKLTLRFTPNKRGRKANFQCRIDDQEFFFCTSPVVWKKLDLTSGSHSVDVRGDCIYNDGVTSTSSRTYTFEVRT